jgi:hypothetical protein
MDLIGRSAFTSPIAFWMAGAVAQGPRRAHQHSQRVTEWSWNTAVSRLPRTVND